MENLLAPPFRRATPKARRTPLLVCLLFAASVCAVLEPTPARAGAQATRRPARAVAPGDGAQRTRPRVRRKAGRRVEARVQRSRKEFPPPPRRASVPGVSELEEDREGRASWFLFKRAYPFDSIPAESRRRAWESRPRKAASMSATARGERQVWSPIGPKPSAVTYRSGAWSGRINAVAVSPADPRIVLAGSATGGIWRSADGGASFAPVSDDHSELAVGWIDFAPSNPAIVYAGMGDVDSSYLGSGVLKSADGGQSWRRVSNHTLPDGVIARLEVDPTNPERLYLAQHLTTDRSNNVSAAGGLFLSTDGGVNWTKTLAGQARDLAIHPANPQTLYAALAARTTLGGFANNGLYRSTDGGATWANVPVPAIGLNAGFWDFRVAVTPADPNRLYVYFGTIFSGETRFQVSFDGGATWQPRGLSQVDSGQFGYNTYLHIDPANPDLVYLGSRDLYKSTNGGVSWENVTDSFAPSGTGGWTYQPSVGTTHADQQAFAFEPGNPSVVYVANDGGLWKSTDGGATLQSLNGSLSLVQFNSLALHPTDGGFTIGGTQDNGTQRRLKDSEGASIQTWSVFSGSDGGACLFNPANPNILFATYFSAWVHRWRVSGSNIFFEKTIGDYGIWGESNLNTRIAFYPPLRGNGVDQRLYFGTWRLFVSDNLGDSWTAPAGMTDLTKGNRDVLTAIGVSRSNTQVIYTGSAQGRAMVSRDGGANWTDVTAGLPNRFIETVVVHPSDPSTAYLSVSGFGTGHVFKTVDGGATWADASGNLPNVPVSALLLDPQNPQVVYAGTDVGVFRSSAGGGAWESFNEGLPPAPVTAFAAQAGGRIQVATYGRGAYELTTAQVGPSSVAFAAAETSVSEGAGRVTLSVTRTGDLSVPAQVDYATADGTASDRTDYTAAYGTLRFAAGETGKTLEVFVTDDRFGEADETFVVSLVNAVNTSLGTPVSANVTVNSNEAGAGPNPVRWDANFDSGFFVRQHYVDFLNREPDAEGLAHWKNQIDECEARPEAERQGCREVRRVNVSAAFFLSIEFQQTGLLVYLTHQAAFDTAERLQLRAFLADTREIGRGLVVGQGDWQARIDSNKAAFFRDFVGRAQFASVYQGMTNAQYVDALNANTAGSLSQGERDALVAGLGAGTHTRADVLRAVAEHAEFGRRHLNRAFVLMQYFGYLRRNPNDPPEQNRDFTGYNHWLGKLNDFNGNYVAAEMVKAFITSDEYQRRFGP
ncbi:MAG TPA: Calx-beta domain-containing protein [Pyrinomonadaceae bacterium]|nr:Calx-beta domain-containing protein [Pyrinomonadaceae bacterium]